MTNVDTRRLSAIMAADIVGYSTMLEQDETRTLANLREFRTQVLKPEILGHSGQIVKNMGDGWLVEFGSTANAVNCATAIQQTLAARELIKLRIGIHIGDIVHEEGDIFGEGVNVAARLEQLAEPGSVLISDVVHRFIDRKSEHEFKDLGKHQLKNISREQLIFGWAPEGAGCISLIVQGDKRASKQENIAQILYFEALAISGSKEEADEVAEELQYELMLVLSRRVGLNVVRERRDGVSPNFILGGRVRVSGEKIRINMTISDGTSGASIRVERFTGKMDEMDDLVIEVRDWVSGYVRNLTNAFAGSHYGAIPDKDLSLAELLSKSSHFIQRWDRQSILIAINSLELAVELAPENPMALAMLASTFAIPLYSGFGSVDEVDAQRAIELANKAVNNGPNIDFVFQARALVKGLLFKDLAGAIKDCERALKVNPYFHIPRYIAAIFEILNGNPETGVERIREYIRTVPDDPNIPFANSMVAIGLMICGENDKARQFALEGYELRPSLPKIGRAHV